MRYLPAFLFLGACPDPSKPDDHHEHEVITAVELLFSGGLRATWSDPEADGDPVVDPIVLSDAEDYTVEVSFLNELEDPPEDLTPEVEAESDQHQIFFTGTAMDSALSYTYGDEDERGYPVGLRGTMTTLAPGSGTLVVTLRHMPAEGGVPVKTGDLAETDPSAWPGENDVEVSFGITVQ